MAINPKKGVWQADGRSNKPNAGRHSLGTRDLYEAQKLVHLLDEKMAVKLGLIRFVRRESEFGFNLPIDVGIEEYKEHIARPKIAGGPRKVD